MHNGIASKSGVERGDQHQEGFWGEDWKARVVGKTLCKVARRMAHWLASPDDELQQGAGAKNTPIRPMGPSSNDEVPHPLMDCGQGKCNNNGVNNDPSTGRASDAVSDDVASEQEGGRDGRASDGEEDATGNIIAIVGVNYPIAGAPHPINKSA